MSPDWLSGKRSVTIVTIESAAHKMYTNVHTNFKIGNPKACSVSSASLLKDVIFVFQVLMISRKEEIVRSIERNKRQLRDRAAVAVRSSRDLEIDWTTYDRLHIMYHFLPYDLISESWRFHQNLDFKI